MLRSLTTFSGLFTASLVLACGGYASSGGDTQDAGAGAAAGQDAAAAEAEGEVDAAKPDPALTACDEFIATQEVNTTVNGWKTRLNAPPTFAFDGEAQYLWHLETNKGPITVRLWPDVAPNHVSSTLYLTRLGFYDGLKFHRVIPGFMAQGGCPLGMGSGGPGYKYAGEFKNNVRHDRPFLLSMANSGPNTDGSQFFLTFAPTGWLDGKHTLFGEIIAGGETMSALEQAGSPSGQTKEPLLIETATIEVKPKDPS